ncbi:LytR/AlgR family response regulator transcription factor [Pollutibacter soli]|uniref:LytR/AlgR family response regulator transcription factor n=1 Tax=Pollutibacter soli TaxID=3034157 RepID=UPI003013F13C
MTKVILIDDEPLARSLVKEYLESFSDIEVVEECDNGLEGVKSIQQHQPDLIFLDIQMPKINGFEMLELLEQKPSVIFTTAFDEYAMKAFDLHAIDYLLKPFSRTRFDQAIQKWKLQQFAKDAKATNNLLETASQSPQQKERIVVRSGTSVIIIPVNDIQYLEAADDFVKIHTGKGVWLKNRTMAHFEKTLDPAKFLRTHRSYIINLTEIAKLEPYEKENYIVVLKSGTKVPVSRTGLVRLKEALES